MSILIALAAAAAGSAVPDAAPRPDTASEDVITVVGRAPLPLADVPVTVDVITAEEIRDQALLTLADALAFTPGVQVVQTGIVGTQASVFIRGTDSDHVLATYDGIRLNSPATPNGAYGFGADLTGGAGRIEVLRGPASATYGSDAIGGVVNTVPALGEAGGSASVSAGELGTYAGSVQQSGERGRLTYALGLQGLTTNGYDAVPGRIVAEERRGERDGADAYQATASFAFAANERWSVEGTFLQREARAEFDGFSGGPTGFQRADADLVSTDRLTVGRAGLAYAEGEVTARLRGGVVASNFEERNDDALSGDVRGRRLFAEALGERRGEGWVLAGGVMAEEEAADVPVSFADPLDVAETHVGGFVFAQATIGEEGGAGPLVLSGTARLDDYEAFGTPATFNAGAVWRPLDGVRVHASYGTAFDAPSLSERFSTGAFAAANPDLGEERAKSGEVGVALTQDVSGGTLTASGVLFRTDTDDLIEFDFPTLQNVNVGDARTEGAELSLAAELPRLRARVAYTYTDAENRDTGEALLRRPEHGVVATLDWRATDRLELSARYGRIGERADVTYSDEGFFGGTGDVAGYDDAAVTLRYAVTEALTGFATVTNLLGEAYEQPAGFGSPPRMVRAGVRTEW